MVMSAVLGDGNPAETRRSSNSGLCQRVRTCSLRLPDTDEVQRVLADRAVMPQFAELLGAAGRHDHCVAAVVGTGQVGYVT